MAALSRDVCRRFSVSCVWGRKRSQSWIGRFTSNMAKAAIMWYFAALTAVSAAFTRWLCGSTSWMSVSWLRRNALIALEHSFSRTWSRGWIPRSQRYAYVLGTFLPRCRRFGRRVVVEGWRFLSRYMPQKCNFCRCMIVLGSDQFGPSKSYLRSRQQVLRRKKSRHRWLCIFAQ